jgi:dodecin
VSHIARIIEVVGTSEQSFEDAVRQAVLEASKSIRDIRGVDVRHFTCKVRDDAILEWRVDCKIAFGVEDDERHLRPEMQVQPQQQRPPVRVTPA